MKKILASAFLFFLLHSLSAQPGQSCGLRVSLLTCSPGDELYLTWGHSALRVIDSSARADLVYNYGTFDFDDPAFYSKFVRGNLLYFVSVDSFMYFMEEYQEERRGVIEQVLDLSCAEKEKLLNALRENALEKNRYYLYDFIADNCTTRLRDMVFKNSNGVATRSILPKDGVSFRNLIHQYLDISGEAWSEFGIDILLGAPLDKKITNNEAMFLPDYLLKGFDSTTLTGRHLVSEKSAILQPATRQKGSSRFSPFFFFSILFLLVAASGFSGKAKRILLIFDFAIFFLAGLLGLFILFMWFGTDHPECSGNYNVCWALPSHFFIIFFIFRNDRWLKFYFLANSILLLAFLASWHWLPQEMNIGLIPLLSIILLRSIVRYRGIRPIQAN